MHLPVMPKPSGLLTPILAKIWRPRSGREERSRLTRWPSLNWSFDREADAYLSLPPFSISRSLSHRNSAALLVTVSDAIGTAFNAVVACRERRRKGSHIGSHSTLHRLHRNIVHYHECSHMGKRATIGTPLQKNTVDEMSS